MSVPSSFLEIVLPVEKDDLTGIPQLTNHILTTHKALKSANIKGREEVFETVKDSLDLHYGVATKETIITEEVKRMMQGLSKANGLSYERVRGKAPQYLGVATL